MARLGRGGSLDGALVDQAVADGLGDGENAAVAPARAEVLGIGAGRFGKAVVQRVDHSPLLLFVGGYRGGRSGKPELRLRQRERGVGAREPARARGEPAGRVSAARA